MKDATTEDGVIKAFEWPQGAGKTATTWSKTEYIFTASSNYVAVRMSWNSKTYFDGFGLYEIEKAIDVTELSALITKTQDEVDNSNATNEQKTVINDAITTAQSVKDNPTSVDEVDEAVTTLEVARQTFVKSGVMPTNDHTFDMTFSITNPSFEDGEYTTGWSTTKSNDTGRKPNSNATYTMNTGVDGDYLFNTWSVGTAITQTVTDLPAGYYTLSCYMATDADKTFSLKGNTTEATASSVDKSTGVQVSVKVAVTDGNLAISAGTSDKYWYKVDDFQLQLVRALTTADFPAYTLVTGDMNAEVRQAQTDAETEFKTKQDLTSYNALTEAITNAQASVNVYSAIKALIDKASALDEAGEGVFNTEAATAITAYNDGTITDGATETTVLNTALKKAALSQDDGADMTLGLDNPSFENGFTGWTQDGTIDMATQGNTSFEKDGVYYAETWQPNGTAKIYQTVTVLKGGKYKITGHFKARGVTSASVYVGDANTPIEIGDTDDDYSVEFAADAGSEITFGFTAVGTGASASWICADNFRLTYVSSDFGELTAVEGIMNKDVADAQTSAIATYNGSKTMANYNAAVVAISNAQASKDYYTAANAALAAQQALMESTNIYDAEGFNTYYNNFTDLMGKYENRTLTNEAVVNPNSATEWRASTAYNFLLTPWTFNGTACNNFEAGMYVNTWSTEGDLDGSNFTVPYFEDWVADANKLADGTFSTTQTGLADGVYTVEALVRLVRSTSDTGDITGLTMQVNDGEAVVFPATAPVYDSKRFVTTMTATGTVIDGNLTISFNLANTNASWMGIKNVKYTKTGDVTYATQADYDALNNAIITAEANTLGFLTGEFAPYNNIDAVQALSAAKAIDPTVNNERSTVVDATSALTGATWTTNTEEVNAVYNGDFALCTNDGAMPGWISSNNTLGGTYHARAFVLTSEISNYNNLAAFNQGDETRSAAYIRFDGTNSTTGTWYDYGQTAGYTMPLKAGVTYCLSFDAGAWGDYANKSLSVNIFSEQEEGRETFSTTLKTTKRTSNGEGVNHLEYFFTPTKTDNYVIGLWNANGSNYAAIFSNMTLLRAETATMTITETNKWATFYAPFAVDIPANVYSYAITVDEENNAVRTKIGGDEAYTLPSCTPVLVYTDNEGGYSYTYAEGTASTEPSAFIGTNYLTGYEVATIVPESTAEYTNYVLLNLETGLGWYKANENTVPANRAFLSVPVGTNVKGIFDFTTEIGAVNERANGSTQVYNLAGQVVDSNYKGIVIVNGKKMLNK